MHNFPPHLSYIVTPPKNTLVNETGRSSWVGDCKDHEMMCRNNDQQISVFLAISSTDRRVCDSPSWLNTRSSTGSHSPQLAWFTVCHFPDARQLERRGVLSFLSSSWILHSFVPTLSLKFFRQLLRSVSFKPIQIINQNMVFFMNAMLTNMAVTCENKYVTFATLKNFKVK